MPVVQRAAAALVVASALLAPASALAVGAGQACGGLVGIQCDNGLFCEMPANRCGAADLKGTCTKAPGVCATIYQPVCGCNGKTYPSDCDRRAAKVAKKADGPCRAP